MIKNSYSQLLHFGHKKKKQRSNSWQSSRAHVQWRANANYTRPQRDTMVSANFEIPSSLNRRPGPYIYIKTLQ